MKKTWHNTYLEGNQKGNTSIILEQEIRKKDP